MKTLKTIMTALAIVFAMNVSAQKTTANNSHTLPPQQTAQIQSQLVDGMVSFVESVRPFYAKGDTYPQFKLKVLIGNEASAAKTALPTLPPEGEAMLQKAYEYLSQGYSATSIARKDNGKTIGNAAVFMYNYQRENGKSSISADVALFGGNQNALENNPLSNASRKKCKWWQLLCHLQSIFGDDGGQQILDGIIPLLLDLLNNL